MYVLIYNAYSTYIHTYVHTCQAIHLLQAIRCQFLHVLLVKEHAANHLAQNNI